VNSILRAKKLHSAGGICRRARAAATCAWVAAALALGAARAPAVADRLRATSEQSAPTGGPRPTTIPVAAPLTPGQRRAELLLKDQAAAWEPAQPVRAADTPRERTDRPIDVTHYDLDLQLSDTTKFLRGTVGVTLTPLQPIGRVQLDLFSQGLTVASTAVDGVDRPFQHAADTLTVDLASPIAPGDTITVTVQYSGTPVRGGPIGFGYDVRAVSDLTGTTQAKVIATLSEPDGARSWWPCHDTPYDAAPVTLSVTAPDPLVLGSAGLKTQDVLLAGGLRRQTWQMPVAIPAYLVSVAMAGYVQWTETAHVHRWPTLAPVDMPVQYYTVTFLEQESRATWANTVEMIDTFERLFGPYPFADLKYGMALFSFAGGMEHPTLSSMGASTVAADGTLWEWAVAHELSHQWFGDCVRLSRWGEIWLNEAFASYCEVLWLEEKHGAQAAHTHLEDKRRDSYPGTLLDPLQLFGTTVYFKGAFVMNMLRRVMGRAGLLQAMSEYVTDPALRFHAVTSADFQTHCETVYRADLGWFFTPWLTREGRPRLDVAWTQERGLMHLTVVQPAGNVYRLPLPLRLSFASAAPLDTMQWVDGERTELSVAIPDLVVALAVDPNQEWLLDTHESTPPVVRVSPAFPNPFNGEVTVPVFVRDGGTLAATVYDVRGRRVVTLFNRLVAPRTTANVQWNGNDAQGRPAGSGVYSVRIVAPGGATRAIQVTLVR
jgi:aminopeptidase N